MVQRDQKIKEYEISDSGFTILIVLQNFAGSIRIPAGYISDKGRGLSDFRCFGMPRC